MSRSGAILLCLTTLAFIASSVAFALRPVTPPLTVPYNEMVSLLSPQPFYRHEALRMDLPSMFLRPQGAGMLGLLAMVWVALAYHALRRLFELRRIGMARHARAAMAKTLAPDDPGPPAPDDLLRRHGSDDSLREHAPLIAGLALGMVWPWLEPHYPLLAFILSAAMLAGFLAAAQRGVRTGPQVERSSSLGFAAGWALMVCLSTFAFMAQNRLEVSQSVAAVVAILIGAIAAVSVQLQLGRRIGFSVAVIWGLIGIAAGTVTSDAAISTATVLAISIIAVALVRVTT